MLRKRQTIHGSWLKFKGFVSCFALMVLAGFSEIGLTYLNTMQSNLITYDNLETIAQDLIKETIVIRAFNHYLETDEIPNDFIADRFEVVVFQNDTGYLLNSADLNLQLRIKNGEIVEISH